ncbi:MAG: ABC transporter permease [Dehalococcoidia bacterium]
MMRYALRRLFLMIPTILLATVLLFLAIRLMPGSAVELLAADTAGSESSVEKIRERLGLDQPAHEQYLRWMGNLFQGDLGTSFRTGEPIASEIAKFLPVSLQVGFLSLLLAVAVAVPVGVIAGLHRDSALDYFCRGLAVLALATPSFWIAILVITWPSVWWGWSPPIGFERFWDDPMRNVQQVWIPVTILGLHGTGALMRFTRTSVLEVAQLDFVRTARAKGLAGRAIVTRHILRNALIPLLTLIGLQIPILVGGVVITETVFSLPGMGRYLITALETRDYQVIQSLVLVLVVFVLLTNLVIDLFYALIDPRIKYG